MNVPDAINGTYEFCGGLFLLQNCFRLYKDKEIKGVALLPSAFFASWGVWNLYFYPSLHQSLSFSGGLLIVIPNITWVGMAIYYTQRKKK
jgi:ABC-type transport system involved in cytochrome c biogenesis permease subunit